MKDIATLLEEPGTTVAVVGATDNPSKYGYVIYRDLKRKGYPVFPVNRHRTEVDGDKAYRTLSTLPAKPTIVNIVVPPRETVKVLQECLEQDLMNVWLQPGAESPESLAMLQEHGFNYLANACIMVQSRRAQRAR
jgi:predicted CoA-binding protein